MVVLNQKPYYFIFFSFKFFNRTNTGTRTNLTDPDSMFITVVRKLIDNIDNSSSDHSQMRSKLRTPDDKLVLFYIMCILTSHVYD